tara:strand:+ start:2078 stop:2302 length:225 start_codon:yes stop_codon:yes gene_type:complete
MFKEGDFELPLEASLKLRVVTDEIEKCSDVKQLQENLKGATQLMMRYQHILQRILIEQISKDLQVGLDELNETA